MSGCKDDPGESHKRPPDSPKSPGTKKLRESISFYEKVWAGTRSDTSLGEASGIDIQQLEKQLDDEKRKNIQHSQIEQYNLRRTPISSPRHIVQHLQEVQPDGTIQETITTTSEEGDLATGVKTVKFETVTVRKSLKHIHTDRYSVGVKTPSRTPSEERLLDDSAYSTQTNGNFASVSKSSSIGSLTDRFSSDENITTTRSSRENLRTPSREDIDTASNSSKVTSSSSEWYSEYRTQSLHSGSSKLQYVRSKSQYDEHIASIRESRHKLGIRSTNNGVNLVLVPNLQDIEGKQ